jgi:ABC-type multidrug transport system fused ATPase/permease subunit
MKYVGYVPQEVFLLDDSILANVAFGEDSLSANVRRVENVISQAKLESFIDSLPNGLETSIGERGVRLSGGQRQRLGIARALYRNPEILVFDEATSSLDGVTEIELMAEIAELGRTRTTIQIAHRLETIKHCDDVYRIRDGGIELLEEKERIELFGKSHLENRK